jgi:pimeloyl-ACP methyl ester carboxylesterase
VASYRVNGIDLYYEVHGEGIPLLLIAGLASDSQSWQPIVPALTPHCRSIAADNRDSGRTTPLEVSTSIAAMADDCIALVKHLGLRSVNVLGHSMGGFVAQECAIRYPEMIAKLVLVGTSSRCSRRNIDLFADWASALEERIDQRVWFRNLFYWIFSARFFDSRKAVDDAVRLAVDYPYQQTARAFRNQVSAIEAFDRSNDLSRIHARTLVLVGGEDLLFPVRTARDFAAAMPNATVATIEDAAHAIHVEYPGVFTRRVLEFLSE